jgi:hypothetical protein
VGCIIAQSAVLAAILALHMGCDLDKMKWMGRFAISDLQSLLTRVFDHFAAVLVMGRGAMHKVCVCVF